MIRYAIPRFLMILLGVSTVVPAVGDATGASFKFTESDVEDIIGDVQKPEVIVFITRENLNKAYQLELAESFLDKIVESVENPPF